MKTEEEMRSRMNEDLALAIDLVIRVRELEDKWGAFASMHELESVLREEVSEVTSEVFREHKSPLAIRKELFDVASAALRGIAQIDRGERFSDVKL